MWACPRLSTIPGYSPFIPSDFDDPSQALHPEDYIAVGLAMCYKINSGGKLDGTCIFGSCFSRRGPSASGKGSVARRPSRWQEAGMM